MQRKILALTSGVIGAAALALLVACGGGGGGARNPAAPGVVLDSVQPETYTYPSLAEANRLRDETGREVDWGSAGTQLGMRVFTNSTAELKRMFREDEGAVMCQGAAYYLHLKYLEAGYRSYLLGMQSDLYSHSVVLVEVQRTDGTTALAVQDPSFNLSYVDSAGEPLSIFDIQAALRDGRPQDVIVQEGLPAEVEFLWAPGDPPVQASDTYMLGASGQPSDNLKFLSYPAAVRIDDFNDAYADAVRDYTAAKGLPNNPLYATFGEPIYVFKRYPMSADEQKEADQVLAEIMAL